MHLLLLQAHIASIHHLAHYYTLVDYKKIDPRVKVLLSSGYRIDGKAKEIVEKGCNGFIQKPLTVEELSQKIREILDKK